jgi:hypothetical protein
VTARSHLMVPTSLSRAATGQGGVYRMSLPRRELAPSSAQPITTVFVGDAATGCRRSGTSPLAYPVAQGR